MEARTARFRRLLEPVHDRVQAFARGLCRSAFDGDDLFQEAALRAYAKLDARFLPLGDGEAADDADSLAVSGAQDYRISAWAPDAGDATARARAALATLPPDQREAIVLFEMEGWQVDEIAVLQSVTASAVKSRLAHGRDRLRAYYERELGTRPASPVLDGETP